MSWQQKDLKYFDVVHYSTIVSHTITTHQMRPDTYFIGLLVV